MKEDRIKEIVEYIVWEKISKIFYFIVYSIALISITLYIASAVNAETYTKLDSNGINYTIEMIPEGSDLQYTMFSGSFNWSIEVDSCVKAINQSGQGYKYCAYKGLPDIIEEVPVLCKIEGNREGCRALHNNTYSVFLYNMTNDSMINTLKFYSSFMGYPQSNWTYNNSCNFILQTFGSAENYTASQCDGLIDRIQLGDWSIELNISEQINYLNTSTYINYGTPSNNGGSGGSVDDDDDEDEQEEEKPKGIFCGDDYCHTQENSCNCPQDCKGKCILNNRTKEEPVVENVTLEEQEEERVVSPPTSAPPTSPKAPDQNNTRGGSWLGAFLMVGIVLVVVFVIVMMMKSIGKSGDLRQEVSQHKKDDEFEDLGENE